MIESEYSIQYFINSYQKFSNDFKDLNERTKLSINIESKLGYENLENILNLIKKNHSQFKYRNWKNRPSSSLHINDVNSKNIFNITQKIS